MTKKVVGVGFALANHHSSLHPRQRRGAFHLRRLDVDDCTAEDILPVLILDDGTSGLLFDPRR